MPTPASDLSPFRVLEGEGRTVIAFPVKLVQANRADLRDLVTGLLDLGRRTFVLDLADCRYIDSSGLGVLVSLNNKIVAQSGSWSAIHVDDDLRTLFQITHLDAFIPMAEPQSHGARRGTD